MTTTMHKFEEMPATAGADELHLHKMRGGRDYSAGHQAMYRIIVEALRGRPQSILEVGFGVGFGLQLLREARCIETYFGCDPSVPCFEHVRAQPWGASARLYCGEWLSVPDMEIDSALGHQAAYSLCLEVIEHVHPLERLRFLKRIRCRTSETSFFSTPCLSESSHGALRTDQWVELMRDAGYVDIVTIPAQWTTFYAASGGA